MVGDQICNLFWLFEEPSLVGKQKSLLGLLTLLKAITVLYAQLSDTLSDASVNRLADGIGTALVDLANDLNMSCATFAKLLNIWMIYLEVPTSDCTETHVKGLFEVVCDRLTGPSSDTVESVLELVEKLLSSDEASNGNAVSRS